MRVVALTFLFVVFLCPFSTSAFESLRQNWLVNENGLLIPLDTHLHKDAKQVWLQINKWDDKQEVLQLKVKPNTSIFLRDKLLKYSTKDTIFLFSHEDLFSSTSKVQLQLIQLKGEFYFTKAVIKRPNINKPISTNKKTKEGKLDWYKVNYSKKTDSFVFFALLLMIVSLTFSLSPSLDKIKKSPLLKTQNQGFANETIINLDFKEIASFIISLLILIILFTWMQSKWELTLLFTKTSASKSLANENTLFETISWIAFALLAKWLTISSMTYLLKLKEFRAVHLILFSKFLVACSLLYSLFLLTTKATYGNIWQGTSSLFISLLSLLFIAYLLFTFITLKRNTNKGFLPIILYLCTTELLYGVLLLRLLITNG